MAERDAVMARLAKKQYARLIEPLRAKARELGYALAVHGSLARDIDLVAVPWVEEAVPAEDLVKALVILLRIETGFAALSAGLDGQIISVRPHGRRAWAIVMGGGSYIDLSVIDPAR